MSQKSNQDPLSEAWQKHCYDLQLSIYKVKIIKKNGTLVNFMKRDNAVS